MISSLQNYLNNYQDRNSINYAVTGSGGVNQAINSSHKAVTWRTNSSPYDTPIGATRTFSASSFPPENLAFTLPFNLSGTTPPSSFSFLGARINQQAQTNGFILICDRLIEVPGFNAASVALQTGTTLPSPSLPRYNPGTGVMVGIEISSQIGTTVTTVIANYTGTDGVTGTTSPVTIGGTSNRELQRMILLPLRPGCTGVSSVTNIQLAATTGTAGGMSVVLFKPLFMIPIQYTANQIVCDYLSGGFIGKLEGVPSSTFMMLLYGGNTSDPRGIGSFFVSEE